MFFICRDGNDLRGQSGWSRKSFTLFILFIVGLSAALFYNGQRALWDTSETRYAEAAREMVASGNWLVPQIGGQPHLTKPPVTYWLLGASMQVFGTTEWAVRFPVAVSFAFSIVLTASLAWRLSGQFSVGVLAGLLQLISPLAFFGSHVVTTDTFVALFVLMYLLAMWEALDAKDMRRARFWTYCTYLALAVAFLTKGPPALLAALATVVFLVYRRKYLPWKRLVHVPGIVLFLLVSASWYVAVLLKVPDALSVWRREALHKVFISSNRDMPAIYYPLILVAGTLPAVIILIAKLIRRGVRKKSPMATFTCQRPETLWFVTCWIFIPLIIFMLAKTRLILYVLPLVPAVNILAATCAIRPQSESQTNGSFLPARYIWASLGTLVILIGIKVLVTTHGDLSKDMKPVAVAIRKDARNRHVIPELLITMDTMGNGLLYYLDGPSAVRVGSTIMDENGSSHTASLAALFAMQVPDEQRQYIIVSDSKMEKYARKLVNVATPVFFNGQWGVFRRTCNGPVELPRKRKSKIITATHEAETGG